MSQRVRTHIFFPSQRPDFTSTRVKPTPIAGNNRYARSGFELKGITRAARLVIASRITQKQPPICTADISGARVHFALVGRLHCGFFIVFRLWRNHRLYGLRF